MLVGQGEGRPFVLILVAREFHSRRLRTNHTGRFFTNPSKTGPEQRSQIRRKLSLRAERADWATFRR